LFEENTAKRIVHEALRVREDDMVLIDTWQHTIDLASQISLECYKAGAKPLMTLMTDQLWWNVFQQIPDEYIRKTPRHILAALDSINVWIHLGGPEDPSKFREVNASHLQQFFDGEKAVLDKTLQRKIRIGEVLIGYVTPQRAKIYGFEYDRWAKMTHSALDVDHLKLRELGRKIAARLERSGKIRVTAKPGTDLRFEINKRPAHVQDGIVDDEDMERGLVSTALPAGKVEVAPIENTAQGTVVFNTPRALKGHMINDLRLDFDKGRIAKYTASSGEEVFREVFEATAGDKDYIAQFAIGINPKAELIGYTTDELVLGTVSIGVGGNKGLGGKNDSDFGFTGTLVNPTVEVDNTTIMKNGKLNI